MPSDFLRTCFTCFSNNDELIFFLDSFISKLDVGIITECCLILKCNENILDEMRERSPFNRSNDVITNKKKKNECIIVLKQL